MSIFDNLSCYSNVFLIWKGGTVDHDGREAVVDTILTCLEGITVVKMKYDWDIAAKFMGILYYTACHVSEEIDVCIISCSSGNLKDNRALCCNTSLYNSLHLLHVVEVVSWDGVSTLYCLGEHISCVHQSKFFVACHKSLLIVKPILI